ncbi:MAG TPA: hypothetical protein DEO62_05820 [Lachnospiraceae bacterium]|jgi:hypothetical protein|nr:hypothetical protein [Lachnospiraceae bacterium]HBR05059.1 hypothetical protein [Lachnospiraceae bacterium]HBZ90518.1 hypothetical protein [Lachnospiraceae bacterium]
MDYSIFYQGRPKRDRQRTEPDFFEDLNMNQVVDAIGQYANKEVNIKPYFYQLAESKEELLYRQSAMKMVESPKMTKAFEAFTDLIRKSIRYNRLYEETNGKTLQVNNPQLQGIVSAKYSYDANFSYMCAVLGLNDALKSVAPGLPAADELKKQIASIVNDPTFSSFKADAEAISSRLERMHITINVSGNKLKINDVSDTYVDTAEAVPMKSIFENDIMPSKFEAQAIELLYGTAPDIFNQINDICQKYLNIRRNWIFTLADECQVYVSYAKFIEKLEEKGYHFTYPDLTDLKEVKEKKNDPSKSQFSQFANEKKNNASSPYNLNNPYSAGNKPGFGNLANPYMAAQNPYGGMNSFNGLQNPYAANLSNPYTAQSAGANPYSEAQAAGVNADGENSAPAAQEEEEEEIDTVLFDAHDMLDIALILKNLPLDKKVIANDLYYTGKEKFLIVTGPNQGGKTTFARSVGQLIYFTTMGLKVAASTAVVPCFKGIMTHFSKDESDETGLGKLKEELTRLIPLMQSNNRENFVILNELFTTAATYDAYRMGVNALKHFITNNCMGIYVTHIRELALNGNVKFKLAAAGTEEMGIEPEKIESSGLPDGSIVSAAAMVDPHDENVRTFKIVRHEPATSGFSKTLVQKYHMTLSELMERLKARKKA